MERGNGNTVLLTVIGVATLLVALVGATFAYFTASVNQDTTPVTVTTTKLAGLTMTQKAYEPGSVIYPGWVGYQAFQVVASGDATAESHYNLSVGLTATGTGATGNIDANKSILANLKVSWCKAENTSITDLDALVGSEYANFTAATVAAPSTVGNTTTYSMTGGSSASMPFNTNACVAGQTTPTYAVSDTSTSKTYDFATNKLINGGQKDMYYIYYEYVNEDGNQTQGLTFTATPAFSVVNAA